MIIEIVDHTEENKGKYNLMNLSYRFNGKLSEKKLVSFGANAEAYKTLLTSNKGDMFNVTQTKNEQGYNDWVKVVPASATDTPATKAPSASPRSTYETPEERAFRQKLIVRQSSVSSAIELLTPRKKEATLDDVLEIAARIEEWVFTGGNKTDTYVPPDVINMKDDIPF